jgi:hypothetical protein
VNQTGKKKKKKGSDVHHDHLVVAPKTYRTGPVRQGAWGLEGRGLWPRLEGAPRGARTPPPRTRAVFFPRRGGRAVLLVSNLSFCRFELLVLIFLKRFCCGSWRLLPALFLIPLCFACGVGCSWLASNRRTTPPPTPTAFKTKT